jgi:predicted metal-binding membrane protein
VLAEKVFFPGRLLSRIAGTLLIAAGLWQLVSAAI